MHNLYISHLYVYFVCTTRVHAKYFVYNVCIKSSTIVHAACTQGVLSLCGLERTGLDNFFRGVKCTQNVHTKGRQNVHVKNIEMYIKNPCHMNLLCTYRA